MTECDNCIHYSRSTDKCTKNQFNFINFPTSFVCECFEEILSDKTVKSNRRVVKTVG